MKKQLVYDLPTRLFHWLFAALFATAYLIANADDESPIFQYHMLAGLVMGFIVVFRVVWGFVGTRYARFGSFVLGPRALFRYLTNIFSGEKQPVRAGHNPASSWAAIAMLGLAAGLGVTGYLMASSGDIRAYKELHELLANTFLAIVLLHIAGVILHVMRHRDGFQRSMIDGCKQEVPDGEAISNRRAGVGVVFAAITAAFAAYLVHNYDATTRTLDFFGSTLRLGEIESETEGGVHGTGERGEESAEVDDN